MRRVLSVAVLAAPWLLGCSDPIAPRGSLGELVINRQKWRAAALTTYAYELRSIYSGGTGIEGTAYVTDGTKVSIVLAGGERVDDEAATIEWVFDRAEYAIEHHPDRLEITYDSELGYPTRIDVDQEADRVDDEWRVFATNVRRVSLLR